MKYTKKMIEKALIGAGSLTDAALRLAVIYAEANGTKVSEPITKQRMHFLKNQFKVMATVEKKYRLEK